MNLETAFVVTSSHAALPGHFPNNPVVPGTVVIDELLAALSQQGMARVMRIDRAKFVAPILVDVPCRVRASYREDDMLAIECFAGNRHVLSAVVQCELTVDKG